MSAIFAVPTYYVLKNKYGTKIATRFKYQLKNNCHTQVITLNKNNCISSSILTEIKITQPLIL